MAEYGVATSNLFALLDSTESAQIQPAQPVSQKKEVQKSRTEKAKFTSVERKTKKPVKTREPIHNPTNKRLFDRRSGTGRPQNDMKKEGGGRHNWGNPISQQQKASEDAKEWTEQTPEEESEKKEETSGEAKPEVKKEEEKEKQLSYDEYLAALQKRAPKIDKLEERTVLDDTPDDAHFGKIDKVEENTWTLKSSHSSSHRGKKEKKHKQQLETNFKFNDNAMRNPRGSSRERKQRRNGNRKQSPSIKMEEKDFPALSATA